MRTPDEQRTHQPDIPVIAAGRRHSVGVAMSTPLGPGVTARNGPTLRETSGMSERGDTPVAAGLTYFRREATARPTRARQNSAASNPASELEPAVKARNPSKP